MGAIDSKVDLGSNSAGKSMLPPPEQTGKKQENDIVSSTDAPAAAAPAPAFSANAKEELIRAGEERPTQLAETSRREEKGVAGGAAVTLDKKKTAPKGAQQMQSRSQEEASEEVQKSALPVAPLAFGTQTDALNMDADKQFEQQLQSASDLLAQGQKQASLDAYQKLLRRFPDREKQILQSIKDPWILDRIKHN